MRASVPADHARANAVIHFAMVAALPIYGVVLHLLSRQGWQGEPVYDPENLRIMTIALGVCSLFELGIAVVLPRLVLREQRLRQIMLSAGDQPLRVALGQARLPYIFRLAILESIGIYGFLLALVGQDLTPFYPFAAVSFVTMVLARFNPEPVLEVYEKLAPEQGWPAQPE